MFLVPRLDTWQYESTLDFARSMSLAKEPAEAPKANPHGLSDFASGYAAVSLALDVPFGYILAIIFSSVDERWVLFGVPLWSVNSAASN